MSILKDIRSGALPKEEVPGFIAWWLTRNSFWLAVAVIVTGMIVAMTYK